MVSLKRYLTPGTVLLALLLLAGTALGLTRAVWEYDLFAARRSAQLASCQNNLKQLGVTMKIYANETRGETFPILSSVEGNLMFPREVVYPRYLTDDDVLVCPGPAGDAPEDKFTDRYYVYTGYLLSEQEDLVAFAGAYIDEIAAGGDFSENLPATTSYGNELFRLREGIERFLITDINNPSAAYQAQAKIPVLWEWPDNHDERYGSNVLYMDGHVEFVHFGEKFPITEEALNVLAELADYTPVTDWSSNHYWEDFPFNGVVRFQSQCSNNMRQVGIINAMFTNESSGERLPPLSSEGGRLMCDADSVYPEYVTDPEVYTCPGRTPEDPELFFEDTHYAYLPYLMLEDNDVQQFASAYSATIAAGGDFSADLEVESSYGDSLLLLRKGVERFLITDINNPATYIAQTSSIPVMLEWPENHEGESGGNVLFFDGHVEWMPYPGEFPMTETTISTLRALAQNTAPTEWALLESEIRPDNYGYIRGCKNNLNQWGIVNKMFASESSGEVFPPLSPVAGQLAPVDTSVYPEYTNDRRIGLCPGPEPLGEVTEFNDQHYVYLGYAMHNDEDMQTFAAAYAAEIAAGGDFSDDFDVETSYGDKLIRLREGIDDPGNLSIFPQSKIPVMLEWPGNHEGYAGGHVLYMDGHVEWHDYPGEFPMTEATIGVLDSIANWTPTTAWAEPRFLGRHDYDLSLCASNEGQIGLALKIFANSAESQYFPPLSTEGGTLMMNDARFFKYDLREMRRLNCPGSANAYRQPVADDHSYIYLGYVVNNQEELERYAIAHQAQIAANGDFLEDLSVGEDTVFRLREGIERFLVTDIDDPAAASVPQHQIPVLIEWPDNHGNFRGGNVLYMDGSVELLDYPSTFPMTEEAMDILTALAGREPIRPAAPPRESTRLEALSGG